MLTGVPRDAEMADQEIFGPVAPLTPFESEAEVIAAANDTEYGLVSYVFTNDLRRALRVAEALESGMVGLNQGVVSNPAAPFGGIKQSGLGREGGAVGIDEFLETKYIGIAMRLIGYAPTGSGSVDDRVAGEPVDGVVHVGDQQPVGELAVAGADRVRQGAVLLAADLGRGVGLVERVDAHPGLGDEGLVHPGQPRAAGELHQPLVEGDVELADVGGRLPRRPSARRSASSSSPAARVVAVEDFARRGAFDRLPGQVHVADVVGGHVDHEQPAVADGNQQSLLGEALHRPRATGRG